MAEPVLVIGLGNRLRGDDAAGPEVARRLRERLPGVGSIEYELEPVGLLDLWEEAELVLVADAVLSGAFAGDVHRLELDSGPVPSRLSSMTSSHAFGLGETIELGRSLDRLPRRLVLYGIEGADFALGAPLSAAVSSAVDRVVGDMIGAISTSEKTTERV